MAVTAESLNGSILPAVCLVEKSSFSAVIDGKIFILFYKIKIIYKFTIFLIDLIKF